ncbi:MAG: hypothetical protein HFJ54_08545 [Clostridia bacterium]|nr:hypothetical protein [Clostridia bacterium]
MKFNEQKERGITLIVLIITIIILVILATVSIRAVFGDRIIQVAADGVRKLCYRTKKRRRNI